MRITQRIAIVGSGRLGFNCTDPFDCNVYLVDCGVGGLALIDAGSGRDTAALLACVRADGFDPQEIRHVLLTHAHADHAGGCAALRQRLGVTVWGSEETARWVSAGDERAISLDAARRAGGYPADYHFAPCPVDGVLADGVPLTIGDQAFLPIATPGHANGHMAFLLHAEGRTCLFAGDLLVCGGEVLLQYTYDCSPLRLGESLLRLSGLAVDALFPGHLHFCLREGQSHIERAADAIRHLLLPRSVS
jgi:glyoxylase-like metal-dependent hydrolase (beta-lactamase superfamily II)